MDLSHARATHVADWAPWADNSPFMAKSSGTRRHSARPLGRLVATKLFYRPKLAAWCPEGLLLG